MKRSLFRIENRLYEKIAPSFVHDFGTNYPCVNPRCHYYKGSWRRHIAVERVLVFFREELLYSIGDAFPFYEFLDSLLGILFGFNCNFPTNDIALYFIWELKGCKPFAVHKIEGDTSFCL